MHIKSIVSRDVLAAATLSFIASVPTGASAGQYFQSIIPTFDPSTLAKPKYQPNNAPTYAPAYTPTNAPTNSSPSVQSGCADGQKCPKINGNLSGIWSVTYPQGPLRVRVVHRGPTLVATLIDGNIAVPAGKVTVQTNAVGSRIFSAEQICAYPGYLGAHFVDARFTVAENSKYMKEDLIGSCGAGSSVEWSKVQ
jgi:hypothetical protein